MTRSNLWNRPHRSIVNSSLVLALAAISLFAIACQSNTLEGDETSPASTQADATPTEIAQVPTATPAPTPIISPSATPVQQSPVSTPKPVDVQTPAIGSPTAAPDPTSTQPSSSPTSIPMATSTPTPPFIPAPPEPDIPAAPDRDLQELGRRLVPGYIEPKTVVPSEQLLVGQQVEFWVSRDAGNAKVIGKVSHVSEHAYWIFELGYEPDPADIADVASTFESDVWPAVTGVFGTPLTPGIDGDDRMVVYTAVLRSGVAGYFSAADSFPQEIRPQSNEREALYMSANRVNLTSHEYLSVIAHELQHATHFATDSSEDSWVNEGLSEVAAEIAGYVRSAASSFVKAPSTSLTAWAQNIAVSAANYGAANLYFAFVASHYGGNEILTEIAQHQEDGIVSVDSVLADRGFDVTADDVFADWLVANYLSTNEGPYGYATHNVPPVKNIYKRAPDSLTGSVQSYGADYVVTSSGSGKMTVEFTGEPNTSLLNSAPHSGESCWWSNHGDSIDATLTRTVDLRSVDSATLNYWVDYEIEEAWDYSYVMVSNDDGATWAILDTDRALNYDPNGNAYGAGLTGKSLGWVQDSVDLSTYAGLEVLLRIEYITDDAVFSKGACYDDFEIPEIGWSDDTSSDEEWTANGFVRVQETIPTQYLVQVIHEKDVGDPVVYQLPVGADAKGRLTVENVGDDDLVITVVSAVTRQSTLATDYTLGIYP